VVSAKRHTQDVGVRLAKPSDSADIANNPATAGLTKIAGAWRFSSLADP
jgi:hypothetical protein